MAAVALFWLSVGLTPSWKKKQIGHEVRWIGVGLSLTIHEVVIYMTKDFVDKLLAALEPMLTMTAIPLRDIRKLTGGLAWLSGVVLWIRAFVAPLWAAIAETARWEGPPELATVGQRQVRHALRWLRLFLTEQRDSLTKKIPTVPRAIEYMVQIVTDACPWGLGGVLLVNQLPVTWFATEVNGVDERVLGIRKGDCAGQAALEALALLVGLREWAAHWKEEPTQILARSDSLAALGSLLKVSSSAANLNVIMQELALDISDGTYEVELVGHIPAALNGWADSLSRLWAPPPETKVVPAALLVVPRTEVAARNSTWWRTRPGGAGARGAGPDDSLEHF